MEASCQAFLVAPLIFRADKKRPGGLYRQIKNNYTLDRQAYPNFLIDAYNTLIQWEVEYKVENGGSFFQQDVNNQCARRGRGRNGRNSNSGGNGETENTQDRANPCTSAI